MTFNVVTTSEIDPSWKLDEAVAPDGKTYYFLFHETTDGWTIRDFGTTFTEEQLEIDGAPSDIKPPS
jgi:hypothetical protein